MHHLFYIQWGGIAKRSVILPPCIASDTKMSDP
jgi:hypothetical protein